MHQVGNQPRFNKDVCSNIFLVYILANVMKIVYVPFLCFTTSIFAWWWPFKGRREDHSTHHRHVQEGLGLIPVPCILKMKLVPPSLPRSSYVSSCFGLYCSACLVILFVSILCMCCSHFSWYYFISFTIFSAPVFCQIHWFFFQLISETINSNLTLFSAP